MPDVALRRMPDELHRELKAAAKENHRSLNGEILTRLAASVRASPIDAVALLERIQSRHRRLRSHRAGRGHAEAASGRGAARLARWRVIVVDTSVMVRLVVGGPDGADAARLLLQDPEWVAPPILMSELRNVLLGLVRRGSLVPRQVKAMCDDAAAVLGAEGRGRAERPGDRCGAGM